MMTPASNQSTTSARPTLMRRLRRMVMMMFMVVALMFGAVPPQPANACVAVIDCVLDAMGVMLMPGGWAQSMAGSISATVSAYFKVIMQSIRMRGQYTSAMAMADYRGEVQRIALQARVQVENISPPNQSTCRATTALRRSQDASASGAAAVQEQAELRLQQMLGLGATRVTLGSLDGSNGGGNGGNGGGNGGGGAGGNPAANGERLEIGPRGNATSASIAREQHACQYMERTPGNIRRCAQLGVGEDEVGKIDSDGDGTPDGEGVALDTDAQRLLNAVAFDNAAHYQAAQDFCSNVTVNSQFEIPSQRASLTSVDNVKRTRRGYAEAAAATFAYFICAEAIQDRMPQGNNFGPIGTDSGNIYASLRRAGWRPLTSLTPWPPVAEEEGQQAPASYASYAGMYYIPGRPPSPRQRRLITEVGLYDSTTIIGSSTSPSAALQHMLKSKAVTLSQNMSRMRQLEKQVLLAGIKLARKVRKGS